MNKFAVIMPLIIVSVFLGYFVSSLEMEHVFAILAITAVGVAIAGILLFHKQQKVGDRKRTRKQR